MGKEDYTFSEILIDWYSIEKRDLPWRQTKDPYKIWLSEIILQQTRVAQGLPYYERFIATFPTVDDLAMAHEDTILRIWQGLGYYSRARNLHKAAKMVVGKYSSQFPSNQAGLLQLPGVGEYTSAAIASFAFDEVVPVLDGNVYRVVSRVFDLSHDISASSSAKYFLEVLNSQIPKQRPADFNQAMMELGALVCTPKNPSCDVCVLKELCLAYSLKKQPVLPVKNKKVKVRKRSFHYILFEHDGRYGMSQRRENDIWNGLYEFLLVEKDTFDIESIINPKEVQEIDVSEAYKHVLTHQRITAHFYLVKLKEQGSFIEILNNFNLSPFTQEQILNLPKPKLLVNYLEQQIF